MSLQLFPVDFSVSLKGPFSASLMLGVQLHAVCLASHVVTGDLNAGSRACTASILPTSQPQIVIVFNKTTSNVTKKF